MALPQMLEGTWEEIKQHEAELSGQRLRVYINPDIEAPGQTAKKVRTQPKQKDRPEQLRGRGMLAGVLSVEEFLRRKHEETAQADEAVTQPQTKSDAASRPSVLGKYAFVAGGSEEFAKEKQAEIAREDSKLK